MYIAQLFGLIGLILLMCSIQSNKKRNVLVFQILANLFFGIQYIMLNTLAAAMMNFIAIIRGSIYYLYAKKDKKVPSEVLVLLFTIIVTISAFTATNMLSILPAIATLMHTYGTWQDSLKKYRIIIIVAATSWLIFNISVGAYVSIISSILELISGIIAIYRYDIHNKETNIS